MDPSLARGLKNQLFRDLEKDIDVVIPRLVEFLCNPQLSKRPKDWNLTSEKILSILGSFALSHYQVDRRRPLICLATFERKERSYNVWNEECLYGLLITVLSNPFFFDTQRIGFSIGEHAIRRIYERTLNDYETVLAGFRRADILKELSFVPKWCPYWTITTVGEQMESQSVFIPSPNGVLLGEVSLKTCHRVELRTFLAVDQMTRSQVDLRERMIKLQEKFHNASPFLLSSSLKSRLNTDKIYEGYCSATKNLFR